MPDLSSRRPDDIHPPPPPPQVGGSFAIFYGYVGAVGLALYLVLRWFKAGVPLAAVWCVYGELRGGRVLVGGSGGPCADRTRALLTTTAA